MRGIALLICLIGAARAEAPTASAAPPKSGAQVSVQVTPEGETTIAVLEGEMNVRAQGEEARIKKGQGAHAKKGQKLQRISILPPPTELKPGSGEHLGSNQVTFSWTAVEGAQKYAIAIRRPSDAHFAKDVKADEPTTTVRLGSGVYIWRVASVDLQGMPGRYSADQPLTIDTTPPRLKAGKPEWR